MTPHSSRAPIDRSSGTRAAPRVGDARARTRSRASRVVRSRTYVVLNAAARAGVNAELRIALDIIIIVVVVVVVDDVHTVTCACACVDDVTRRHRWVRACARVGRSRVYIERTQGVSNMNIYTPPKPQFHAPSHPRHGPSEREARGSISISIVQSISMSIDCIRSISNSISISNSNSISMRDRARRARHTPRARVGRDHRPMGVMTTFARATFARATTTTGTTTTGTTTTTTTTRVGLGGMHARRVYARDGFMTRVEVRTMRWDGTTMGDSGRNRARCDGMGRRRRRRWTTTTVDDGWAMGRCAVTIQRDVRRRRRTSRPTPRAVGSIAGVADRPPIGCG